MKIKGLVFFLFGLFISCNSDEPDPIGTYSNGILVINEGAFNSSNGSLSFIDAESMVQQNVFSAENNGLALGDIVQSVTETADYLFVIVNNSHKVYALDPKELTLEYIIEDVSYPSYAVEFDDYLYLAEWVGFGEAGRLTKIDVNTGAIVDRVTVGEGAAFPTVIGNEIYVSNNFGSSISVISPATMEVTATLITGNAPGQIIQTENGDHWVICSGGYDENFLPLNDGMIQKLENADISFTLELNQNIPAKGATKDNYIYVYSGNKIWEIRPQDLQINEYLTDDQVIGYYGIAFDDQGELYLLDHQGFQSPGKVIHYSPAGQREDSYTVGIGPNGLIFR